jgi:uncharacterized protein (TIGR02996 family)
MTSQDEQSFLTAILAAPEDDTPRLVFADWLDERGSDDDKARAALIRAQCRAEYLAPNSKERLKLEREALAILKAHSKRWLEPIRKAELGHTHVFRRGFLDGLTISSIEFIRHGKRLFELAPTLRTVRFPNAANEVTELAESPFLARLASVDLTRMCTCGYCHIDEELRDLFGSKHAQNLRYLNLSHDRMDDVGARGLARSPHLANLTTLDLSNNPLGTEGLAALAKSKHLGKLTTLVLSRIGLPPGVAGSAGLVAFARSKNFPALAHLELSENGFNAASAEVLVGARFFPQLTHLDLSKNRIGEQGARALARAEGTKLEVLNLTGTRLGPRAIKLLKAKFGKKVKV